MHNAHSQSYQINIAVVFWYLVKSTCPVQATVHRTHDKSLFTWYRNTRPCLTGHLVGDKQEGVQQPDGGGPGERDHPDGAAHRSRRGQEGTPHQDTELPRATA